MRKYNSLIDAFVEDIGYLDKPFGLLINDGEPENPIYFEELQEQILDIDSGADFHFGMSKFVITAPSLGDIVIKVPFSGTYDYYGDDCADNFSKNDIVINEGDYWYTYTPFYKQDYCQIEYKKYKALWRKNLDCFVAKTQYYKTLPNGISVFLQEKVIPKYDDWHNRKPSLRSKDIAKRWIYNDVLALDSTWLASCIDFYGEPKTRRFMDYCNNEDTDILADPHSGNLGYREDNTPVILDYSNFID